MSLKRSSTTQPGNMTFSRDGPDEQQAEAVHHQQGGRNPAHVQAEAVRRLLDGRQAEAVHQQGGRNQAQAEAVRRLRDGRQADGVRHFQEDERSRTRAETVRRLLDERLAVFQEQAEAVHHQQGGRNPAQAEAVRRLLDGRQAEGVRHDQEDDRSRTRAEGVLHPCGAQGLAANPQRGMPLPGNVRGVQHGGQQRAEAVRYLQDTAGGHSSPVRAPTRGQCLERCTFAEQDSSAERASSCFYLSILPAKEAEQASTRPSIGAGIEREDRGPPSSPPHSVAQHGEFSRGPLANYFFAGDAGQAERCGLSSSPL